MAGWGGYSGDARVAELSHHGEAMERDTSCVWCAGRFCCGDNDFYTFGRYTGRLHCLEDAVTYADLSGDDMDIEVTGCLIYGVGENGENAGYDTGVESLWEKFLENR